MRKTSIAWNLWLKCLKLNMQRNWTFNFMLKLLKNKSKIKLFKTKGTHLNIFSIVDRESYLTLTHHKWQHIHSIHSIRHGLSKKSYDKWRISIMEGNYPLNMCYSLQKPILFCLISAKIAELQCYNITWVQWFITSLFSSIYVNIAFFLSFPFLFLFFC